MTVTRPVALWTLPIAWGGGIPIAWAQPPKAPSSLRIADATEHATPPCAVGCLAMSRLLFISRHAHEPSHPLPALPRECARAGATFGCLAVGAIHAHCFSPVIYNETLCRYTNFPFFSRETASGTEPVSKTGETWGAYPPPPIARTTSLRAAPGVTASKSLS